MVAQAEVKQIQPTENGNVRLADPAVLMQQNPAALIVNPESYARIAARFDPDVFDPPPSC